MAPRTPDMQRQQSGFTALDSLRNNAAGLKLPDFSRNNQFQGNPMAQASSGLGGSPTSFGANPFGMSGGAAAASANLPSFGGAGSSMGGGGGGAGAAIASSAAKIVASNEKLVAALNNLASKLGGGKKSPGGGGGGGGGQPSQRQKQRPFGGKFSMNALGQAVGMAVTGTGAMIDFDTQQMGFQANAMAAQNQEVFFKQSLGGMGSQFRSMGVNQNVANAKRDSAGNIVSGVGAGTMMLGGLAVIGGLAAAPFTAGTSLTVSGYGLGAMGIGGSASMLGNKIVSNAGEAARVESNDQNSAEYQRRLAQDREIFTAGARGAVRGSTNVGQYFQGRASFSGGEGANAVSRAARFKRKGRQFSLLASIGNELMMPMEQAGFEFMANVSMRTGRYSRFMDPQGRINTSGDGGLLDINEEGSVLEMSAAFGSTLGIGNVQATKEMNAIASAQGFRGIEHNVVAGENAILNPITRAERRRRKRLFKKTIRAGDPDGILIRGLSEPTDGAGSIGAFQGEILAGMAANPHANAADNMTGAAARQLAAYGRAPLKLISSGTTLDQDVLASGTNDFRDPVSLRRNNHNRAMGLDTVLNARQRGFSAATIGLAGQIGRGGMGGMHSADAKDLINEAAFLDLRGAGAQQHIKGRLEFFSKMSEGGFNPRSGGFTMAVGGNAEIGLNGPGAPTLFQRGFSADQMQMEGEINTVINRGRARRLQSFMGGNFGNRANEMRQFAEKGTSGIKGILGGFGEDVLMASVLAENDGDIAGSMRTMHEMGPLSARRRFKAAGFSGKGLRDALLSLPGMTPDTVDTILQSPDRLENLSQKERTTLGAMAEKSVGGAKAEKEIQRMENFNKLTFRMMTAAEANKEANEISKATLKDIEAFLKDTFSPAPKKKAKEKKPPKS
jgi:hypothetical protein